MGKRLVCLFLSLLLALPLAGCGGAGSSAPCTVTYMDVFDTVSQVTVYGVDKAAFDAGEAQLHRQLEQYHRLFDIYTDYEGVNNLKTVNDRAGGDPVAVDAAILDLLEYGLSAYALTGGRVNILFGAVLSLWHDCRAAATRQPEAAALPSQQALQAAAAHVSPDCLEIDRQAGTVRLTDPLARIDVGAVAKGFAVQRTAEFVQRELGWNAVLLNVGGNVRAVGSKPGETPFTIGIQNPDVQSAKTYLCTVEVCDQSVVTSGDYQRYFTVDGKRYAHIIDVDTLFPAAYMQAVSVVCEDSARADVLSTALFAMPVQEGRAWLAELEDAEAVWVLPDGSVEYSDGFAAADRM